MKQSSFVLFFFLYISFVLVQGRGKQTDALDRLYKAKKQGKVSTDHVIFSDEEIKVINGDQTLCKQGLKENDRIESLPGQPPVKFTQYGGYVTIDESAGRAFYYYFTEAEQYSKHSKPLLLWLNGGPGCSSLAYGAMQELGPFRVHSDGKTLYKNPYAWNKEANVLFLESPAGVGFSYSNRSSDYNGGDEKTAADNYLFLLNWFEKFPEYKNRPFFLSGESYAGHYVPQLAHTILQHNKIAKKNIINLKGIIIGNAVIHDETDEKGMYDFFWTHALVSDEDNYQINKYCDFSPNVTTRVEKCSQASDDADKDIHDIDIYNIYAPICKSSNLTDKPKKTSKKTIDPCSDYYVYAYLNSPDVQEALHANVTKLKYDWQPCSDVIRTWSRSPTTMLPLLREFMENGIRVWVFSGDTDGRVPVTSTRYSLNKLKLPVKTKWQPWFVDEEVGGYTVVYKGDLTFATVRGAGHQVPSYQPARALTLIKSFLYGKPLPKK